METVSKKPRRKGTVMLSLIEVQCPHCGARGQVQVPPVSAMIVGPCPQCNELVLIFCGQALAVDKNIIVNGSTADRREHLEEITTKFLRDRIAKLFPDDSDVEKLDQELLDQGYGEVDHSPEGRDHGKVPPSQQRSEGETSPISQTEFERFTDVDLKLLDNKAYFTSVFGPPKKR